MTRYNHHRSHARVAVVMVPFPAQGHLNQLLQLSCLISSYGVSVHYVASATHSRQARFRANGLDPKDIAKIQFHELPTPEFDSPSPNPNASNKFPAQLQPSWEASMQLRQPLAEILRFISSKSRRLVVINDPLMGFVVQDVGSISNAECYAFNCFSAFTQFFLAWEAVGKPMELGIVCTKEQSLIAFISDEAKKFFAAQADYYKKIEAGDIYNTSRLIEGTFMDLLAREEISRNRKQWAIGPILPLKLSSVDEKGNNRHKCLEWLDKQEWGSVIFISFGTTTSLSDEQIKEIAIGLEQSKQKFIWVIRDADKGNIFTGGERKVELPKGFEKRVEGFGMVVRDWAPQVEILAHPTTGGFMSHCGWNSCMESITMGVAIAAWPMHSDQPRNSILITEILKLGLLVKESADSEEIVTSRRIENVVKRLMASEEGDEIRKRAEALGIAIRLSTKEGGVSHRELDSFVSHITR
ncbi:hypothetical protein M9H77_04064 [Catharanthus roseus]|uniref:Uncharacterized protein n=1 Tax=Catharanthus roseus TaxID=4058 RepID=A0ACC0CD17_CATRO|nr:hypothetical protein M9H77_04064 [Catharanthus roseus]